MRCAKLFSNSFKDRRSEGKIPFEGYIAKFGRKDAANWRGVDPVAGPSKGVLDPLVRGHAALDDNWLGTDTKRHILNSFYPLM